MKVLFINPPTPKNETWIREGRCQQFDIWGAPFPPLSLAMTAGQIKDMAQIETLDCAPKKLKLEKVLEKIRSFNPDIIFLTVATPTIDSDLGWFARAVKNEMPQIKIAALGIHITALPKETLERFPSLDFVISGEPEIIGRELVNHLKTNEPKLSDILGLGFRERDKIIINNQRPFIENLDDLEKPDWSGVDFKDYLMPIIGRPFNLIVFSRGCPYNCRFCSAAAYYGKKIRQRSPEKIIDEIEENMDRGIYDFLFWTESATVDRKYLFSVLDKIIEEGLNKKIRWVSNSRVDFVDLEIFQKMRKSGCWQIIFGIEFGSDQILKLANKGGEATVAQAQTAANLASEAGLAVDGHFILGFPGENKETMKETIDLALKLPLTFAHFYMATPFPGSLLFIEARERYWLREEDFSRVSQNEYSLKTGELSEELVSKMVASAYGKFYKRPIIFWRILKLAKTPRQFLNLIKIGTKFIFDLYKK
ncbi:MAG: hypothetical protein A3A94_03560 [Candidatus Portnoybacteria bacterium RIFCSPLOWO2_01_FULL_43_11]|uniref:Uncharacterized protein n=4 Tax=Bacteria candidate phyla TaxID=1783234 RepID=A0A1G2FRW1_9BACT|nr:MAG: hypothetical protein A2713_01895 [candidate division WWE3 bacterium RIFCSPHIGHO2_01_FULL_35_17]OGZ37721.1 MAG: hypothetical protein A3E90_00555 [Candidatus Portnoybacteria bacterium RIFCSPHIGHO2_12_FULL_40_11]OGZ38427.1 MAG: hypothetical protein A3A94_03560 [Candidatus Portnoybacteria bacterium RIFCSPLOWO2_01_FULL_43_11]OGZ40819.1 MAG: hypothetical protein A3I20_02335 [Candidatus Portnoybacteria bacterium RIFCSPLOWO2_02_FULL_40_15]